MENYLMELFLMATDGWETLVIKLLVIKHGAHWVLLRGSLDTGLGKSSFLLRTPTPPMLRVCLNVTLVLNEMNPNSDLSPKEGRSDMNNILFSILIYRYMEAMTWLSTLKLIQTILYKLLHKFLLF